MWTFRKEGEYWTLGIGGRVFPLRDAKGLAYLAHLLRYPGRELHVLNLAAGISDSSSGGDTERMPRGGEDLQKAGIHVGRLGDAGEVVDDQAKRAYRCRLAELRQESIESNSKRARLSRRRKRSSRRITGSNSFTSWDAACSLPFLTRSMSSLNENS